MPSTFFGLTIGKTGLYASSAALNTTAHNASNATTEGYSRQKVSTQAGTPVSVYSKAGMSGSGVTITSIERERNIYYDEKYRTSNTAYGCYKAQEYYLSAIETYFKETDSSAKGITSSLSTFYTALEDLKDNPADSTTRTAVKEAANNLTEYINYLAQSLQSVQQEANADIKTTVERINSIASQVATLNKQINTLELQGGAANDLRDQRDLLIDELSEYCNVSVNEIFVGDDTTSLNQYVVKIDGVTLVDSYIYNTIEIENEDGHVNMNDVDHLYKLKWNNGQDFNMSSPTLGGKLQALLQVRDGNDGTNFFGTIEDIKEDATTGKTSIVVTDSNCEDVNLLNLPEEDGKITIGAATYYYDSFSVDVEADGSYTYTFKGITTVNGSDVSATDTLLTSKIGRKLSVGDSIDFKGVPYYQAKLNQFVRTYASAINEIHNQGQDLNGDQGLDLFTGVEVTTGIDYILYEQISGFSSNGNAVSADGTENSGVSYYRLTALNSHVNTDIQNNVMKLALAENVSSGVEESKILDKIIATKGDSSMFNEGKPAQFLESFTADIGTQTQQVTIFATSQKNICDSIDNQRMSVSSVDQDEEAMNLVKYQNAYELSAKVVSTMQQIYDVLLGMV